MHPTGYPCHKARVLLVGPRITENDVVGGPQVSFELLLDDLRRRAKVGVTGLSTARPLANRGRLGKARLDTAALVTTLARVWRHAPAADLVVWYVSPRAALLGGAFIWIACTLRRRPLCIRFFGGNFDGRLAAAPWIVRFVAARTFLRADLVLCQTRRLAASLGRCCRTAWLPNTRSLPPRRRPHRDRCRRLLFLSVLQAEKGLPELLAAAERFPPLVRLSVFGPEVPGFDPRAFDRLPNAAYGGSVPPERVPEILETHDTLVLPARYENEGYPGVVIEAFQMGLPAIVTRWPSLEELVTDGQDGLFVEVGSVDSLVDAVARLCSDDELFRRLRNGALASGERYRNDRACELIEDLCERAASGQSLRGPLTNKGTFQ